MPSNRILIAVDGGNSKTEVVLADGNGAIRARRRGPGSSPHLVGTPETIRIVGTLIDDARADAALPAEVVAERAEVYVAGADLPEELAALSAAVRDAGWAREFRVDNDTFALLRAGTDAKQAIAVVCGAGINCVGRDEAGRLARFPALGWVTGDWGGGIHLATQTLWHAARGEDGRGPATALSAAVSGHFGAASAEDVGVRVHLGQISSERLLELTPLLFRLAAACDPVAQKLVLRQAEEIVALARVAAKRLDLSDKEAVVVLGGGILAARHPLLHDAVVAGLAKALPKAEVTVPVCPPVAGAVLFGLDAIGAPNSAKASLTRHFG